jgi:hypothetical protein
MRRGAAWDKLCAHVPCATAALLQFYRGACKLDSPPPIRSIPHLPIHYVLLLFWC